MLFMSLLDSAEANCLFPLFDPLHWFCGFGHSNPYATRRFIDDWLGYGYMRGTEDGSLGHYPLKPWNCYAPMYPRLQAPAFPAAPMPVPMTMPAPPPVQMPLAMPAPFMQQNPWGMPQSGGWGCGNMAVTPMPYQMPYQPAPLSGDCCNPCDTCDPCQQMTCQPVPVQVPVTTYRPVTVDRGGYQMVWVPRPVTQLVPQTSWQTQYVQPGPMYSQPMYQQPMQMQMQMPGSSEGCCGGSASSVTPGMMPGGTAWMQNSMSYGSTAYSMPGNYMTASPYSFQNPGYTNFAVRPVPLPSVNPGYPVASGWGTHRYPASQPYPMATASAWGGAGYSPAMRYPFASNRYPYLSNQMYPAQPVPQMAYIPRPMPSAWQPVPAQMAWQPAPAQMAWQPSPVPMAWNSPQQLPMSYQGSPAMWSMSPSDRMAMGDVMGDHEVTAAPATGMVPVIPNSFSGRVPVTGASFSRPIRTASVNRYPNVVR